LDDAELNEKTFFNGWFRTGDIGHVDDDGFLVLHGRKGDTANRGGEKVSLAEIDAALLSHPGIVDAAAFVVSHPRLGEDVAAAVVVEPDATVTPQELRTFLTTRLAPFKIPRRISIVARLPRGTTGKVQRWRLAGRQENERD
jgi:acyl-CoA synthetase (AMP-forming)/AMP-acid ligase II